MRRARIRDGLLVALSLLALAVPGTTHLMGLWQATPQSERRPLSKPPAWPTDAEKWRIFAPTLESYLADRIGLRAWLMLAAHRLRFLIGAPVTPEVVMGKEGWLFYGGVGEIEQYLGLRPICGPQIQAIVSELERYRLLLRARGISFVFVIAPNKTSIYPEYLPEGLHPVGPTPADQLMSALAEWPEIPVVDGRKILRPSKNIGRLYFQTDTHWNDIGAYITLQAAMARIGLAHRLRPLDDYRIELTSRTTDLLLFLNMGIYTELNVPALIEKFLVPGISWSQKSTNGDVSNVITSSPPARGRIVVIGDSFSDLWLKFLADSFARIVHFTNPEQPHLPAAEVEKPDVVILEVVERHLLYWWPRPPEN